MSVYIPGEKLGLTPAEFPGENVDALTFNDQGKFVFSTQGQAEIGPDIFEDEDLFISDSDTSASLFFDGSDYALNEVTENVDGVWLGANGSIYLSTAGSFSVSGISGEGADIFVCAPGIFMNCWFIPGLFWNGSAHGIPNMSIDDFYLGGYIQCDNLPLNCSFEQMFAHWTVEAPNPQDENWLPTTSEYHGGWYSAMAEVNSYAPEVPYLISSSIPVQPVGVEYRFSFYGKASDTATGIRVGGHVYWYNNDQLLGQMLIGIVEPYGHTDWTLFATPFTCPWPGANRAVMFFEVGDNSFVQGRRDFPAHMFIDDVKAESRPVANCPLLNAGGN